MLLAQTTSVTQPIAYGAALCSSYPLAKVPTANHRGELRLREMLATKASLDAFLSKAAAHRGVKKARRALQWVVEGAASPREAEIALDLFAPRFYDGQGLPIAELNTKVDLDDSAARMFGTPYCYPDFLWRDKGLVLEYDSNKHHSSAVKMQKDARRRNAPVHMGFTVLTYTNDIFVSPSKKNALIEDLEKRLMRHARQSKVPSLETRRSFLVAAHKITRGNVC